MNKKDTQRLVLIDAHAILHRGYHALPEFASSKGEPTGALYGLASMLMKLIGELKPDYLAACFDMAAPTFRHEAYEQYKSQRPKAEEDLVHQINRSRDIFRAFGIPMYEQEGFEADDLIGTIVAQMKEQLRRGDIEIIIASGDMDTMQLVDDERVRVFTLKKGLNDTVLYDEDAVKERFMAAPEHIPDIKGLQGDPSDNIPGVAGIGEKTAKQLVSTFGSIETIYETLKRDEQLLTEKGVKPRIVQILRESEEEALFSKELATIRKDAPISFTLPEKPWYETFAVAQVEELFSELEFRTLTERARSLAGVAGEQENEREEHVSADELEEAAIALWLLDSNITQPTLEDITRYAGTESLKEARAFLETKLHETGLDRVYNEIELPLRPILKQAHERGVLIDTEHLNNLSEKLHRELDALQNEIYKLAGVEFNINSPAQMSEVLFDTLGLPTKGIKKTSGGAISTRESELQKLYDAHPVIARILDYRELQKLLSTYIDNLPSMLGEDGRLHTRFVQTGTTTGRLASREPNMQNIPVKGAHGKDIRRAFIAADNHHLLAFDYSQIELRVLAYMSGDAALTEIFRAGLDVHASVAAHVYGVSEDDVTKEQRRKAKVINFGIIYGMGVTSLQKNLGTTRAEAQSFYDEYFAQFPSVLQFIEEIKREAAKRGYTETAFGRRRYIEGMRSSIPYVRSAAERMAFNAPIQGTAADIIKLAMIRADEELRTNNLHTDVHLLLQIHDELIYEVTNDKKDTAARVIQNAMEHVVDWNIPLDVDGAQGANWGEMKPI